MLAAIETSLASADKATKRSFSSGFTVPVEAECVLKHAALQWHVTCATRYLEDDLKERLAQLTALLQKSNIDTKAKRSNTFV